MMAVRPAAIFMNRWYTACSSSGSNRRRRFVQQDRVVLAKQPARDRQPLPLSEGEVAGAELPRQGPVGRHQSENRRGADDNW